MAIAKDEINTLKKKSESLQQQIDDLTKKQKNLSEQVKNKIKAIRTRSIKEVIAAVDKKFEASKSKGSNKEK